MYCAESVEEICIFIWYLPPKKVHLFSVSTGICSVHIHIYIIMYIDIEEIQGTESPKSRKIQQVMIKKTYITFLLKQCILRSSQRVPL